MTVAIILIAWLFASSVFAYVWGRVLGPVREGEVDD